MKFLPLGLFFALIVNYSNAQKPPIKFGDIPMEDLKMVRYDKDSVAEAVILADFGQSSIIYNQNTGFSLKFERITRIKILTKEGFEWADFEVQLYHDDQANKEKLLGLKAVTYNLENGKVSESKLKSDAIFREKVNENWDMTKFTLPNVREGSVIEVSYEVTSDFLFNFQDWSFQSSIPVRWSEYRARIPEYYNYDKYMQGYVLLEVSESKDVSSSITINSKDRNYGSSTQFSQDKIDFMENQSRWAAKDVPAFKPEPFITTSKDYISKINFELAFQKFPDQAIKRYMGSWEDISRQFGESQYGGKEITGNGYLKKIVEEITAGASSPEQKLSLISAYVKHNIDWNGESQRYSSGQLKKIMEEKKGSSADINLLLGSMLDKAGFEVSPVLISTRDHGFVRESNAISSQFNYVICLVKINDKSIMLDATDDLLPTGILPQRCLNGRGLVVSGAGAFSWAPLKANGRSLTYYNADLALSPEGELKGLVKVDRSGYFAQMGRKKYLAKGETDYVKDLIGNRPWTISKSEFTNSKEIAEPFRESHQVVINDHATATDALIYLNPFVILREEQNPFKLETRQYPVDFGSPREDLYVCRLKIPDGYQVDELPQNRLLKLPDNAAKYTYSLSQNGDIITFTSSFQINNSLFLQADYPHLREFYNQVISKQAEQIVLKKK